MPQVNVAVNIWPRPSVTCMDAGSACHLFICGVAQSITGVAVIPQGAGWHGVNMGPGLLTSHITQVRSFAMTCCA